MQDMITCSPQAWRYTHMSAVPCALLCDESVSEDGLPFAVGGVAWGDSLVETRRMITAARSPEESCERLGRQEYLLYHLAVPFLPYTNTSASRGYLLFLRISAQAHRQPLDTALCCSAAYSGLTSAGRDVTVQVPARVAPRRRASGINHRRPSQLRLHPDSES